jgi:flagellar hook-associated protein 2
MSQGITFSGLSSGLDINGIVGQLMNLERIPIQRIQRQQALLTQDQSVYSGFRSRITSFTSALSGLNQASTFNPLTANSSTAETATLSASSTAIEGTYELKVFKLAQAHKISSTAQSSTTDPLAQTGVFKVNGKEITVEATDSLSSIAGKINGADAGVTASLINGGAGKAYLTLTAKESGAGSEISLESVSGTALSSLGGIATEILAAQDAEFELDGLGLTSSKNEINDVIPGSTLTLRKANIDGSQKSTLSIAKDSEALKTKLREFRDSFNSVIDFIRQNSAFDSESYKSGPLFGNTTAAQVETSMNDVLLRSVGTGTIKNLTQLGFSLDEDGRVTFDESAFSTAIASNPDAVSKVMAASGTGSNSSIRYVTSSTKTKAGTFQVNVTQAATKSVGTAATAQTTNSGGGEVLTFGGSVFGGKTVLLTTNAGSAGDLVSQINNDSRLRDFVSASLDNDGKLKIESRRFGAGGAFSVTSDQAGAASNSGIGTTGLSVTTGLDVQGTIDGKASTGTGQFLMGNTGTDVEGLQVMISGSDTGNIGTISFSQGIANQMTDAMFSFTDSVNGLLTAMDKSIQTQLEDMDERIARINSSLTLKEDALRKRFALMEESMSRFQSQGSMLSNFMSGQRS